jgi:hypothetical protein
MEEEAVEPKKRSQLSRIATIVGVLLIGAGLVSWAVSLYRGTSTAMTTPYQAVPLSNGSAYFGKLEGLGTDYPVLREVFYVQSVKNPQTNQVSSILVKRGKEWHSPDRMILNSKMIVLVEPVSPGSRVAHLIAEARNQ